MPSREQYRNEVIEKRTNHRQFAFEIRERKPGFKVKVVPLVISSFSGGIKEILKELENMFDKDDFMIITALFKGLTNY